MATIMVAGGFDAEEEHGTALETLAKALGRGLVQNGHHVLTGGQTEMDRVVACSAAEAATEMGLPAEDSVTNYLLQGSDVRFDCGRTLRSQVEDWERIPKNLRYPEPIMNADAVVVLGGWDGTHRAANWARLAGTPVVPVPGFGFASEEIFHEALDHFDERYGDRLVRGHFEQLNEVLQEPDEAKLAQLASNVIALAERLISPSDVFVVMSFSQSVEFQAIYKVFKEVVEAQAFHCYRVDDKVDKKGERVIPAIIDGIRKSAFVIADVTDPKINVYYELGIAHGADLPVIITAREGTEIPFDIFDVPIVMWSDLDALTRDLQVRVADIAKDFGR